MEHFFPQIQIEACAQMQTRVKLLGGHIPLIPLPRVSAPLYLIRCILLACPSGKLSQKLPCPRRFQLASGKQASVNIEPCHFVIIKITVGMKTS